MKSDSFKLRRHTLREICTDILLSVVVTALVLGAIACFVFAATR